MTGQQSGGPGILSPLRSSCLLPDFRGDQGERRQQLKSFHYCYLSQMQMLFKQSMQTCLFIVKIDRTIFYDLVK